jgi:hypothetical protein
MRPQPDARFPRLCAALTAASLNTMKLTTTIVLSFQAQTLAEAGAKLDDVLAPARAHEDIEIKSVELQTPSVGPPVALPHAAPPPAPPSHVPHPLPGSG